MYLVKPETHGETLKLLSNTARPQFKAGHYIRCSISNFVSYLSDPLCVLIREGKNYFCTLTEKKRKIACDLVCWYNPTRTNEGIKKSLAINRVVKFE